jgi:hypothetical protein
MRFSWGGGQIRRGVCDEGIYPKFYDWMITICVRLVLEVMNCEERGVRARLRLGPLSGFGPSERVMVMSYPSPGPVIWPNTHSPVLFHI